MKKLELTSRNYRQVLFLPVIRIRKTSILCLSLFLLLFSSSVLYNEKYLKIYILISILICILAFLRGIKKPYRFIKTIINSFTGWLIILFAMYFYYGLASTNYFNADYFFFMFIMTLVNMLLFIDIPAKDMMQIFIKACALASVSVCLFIFNNEWPMIFSGTTRIGSTGSGNVNTVAIRLGMMVIPCYYKFYFERNYIYFFPYLIGVITMLLTGSKQSLIFIIMSLTIFTIIRNGFRIHKYIFPLTLIMVVFSAIFYINSLYNIIGKRIIDFIGALGLNIEGAQYSYSTTMRLFMYKKGIEAFKSKPIFGGGWFYFSEYTGLGTYSHSNYIELLVTYGIVGFLLYYSLVFYILLKLFKLIKKDRYSNMLFVLNFVFLLDDFVAIQFSMNSLYYFLLCFSYLYIKNAKKYGSGKVLRHQTVSSHGFNI